MHKTVNFTIYILFFSIYFFDGFLAGGFNNTGLHIIPSRLSWSCELISVIATFYFLILYAVKKKVGVSNIYILFFTFSIIFVFANILINTVPSGAVFAGIRRYLLYVPLFFLPTVYGFSEQEIRKQLKFLLLLGLVQIPFVIYQRFFMFRSLGTGDVITGSLMTSSVLTLNQMIAIAIITAMVTKKKIAISTYIVLLFLLFIPTAVNETKVTLFLAPIAVALPIFFGRGSILNIRKIIIASISTAFVIFVFGSLYSYLYNVDLIKFFDTSEDRGVHSVSGYLYKGLTEEDIEAEIEPGRFDSLSFPFKLIKDPMNLIFGLGMGNVNLSGMGQFEGEYTHYNKYGASKIAVASIIWEVGLMGLFLYLAFFCLILKDGFSLRHDEGLYGALSVGWIAIIVILFVSLFYANIFHIKAVGYSFFYGSGLVAARRYHLSSIKAGQSFGT